MPLNVEGYEILGKDVRMYEQTNIVRSGLVLHLDASIFNTVPLGSTWFDLSGNGYDGTLVNSVGYNSNNGGYFEFDGTDTRVSTNLTRDNNNFSYSAWFVHLGGSGERNIIDTFETSSQEWTRLNVQNNKHAFHIDNDGIKTVLTGSSVQTGIWYNSAGTWDPSSGIMKLYVNGNLDAQTSKAQTSTISGLSSLTIGANTPFGSEYFDGYISSIFVYNRTLSATEIAHNYNVTKGRFGL